MFEVVFADNNRPLRAEFGTSGSMTANFGSVIALNNVHFDTMANWNAQPDLIGVSGHLYVYTDYAVVDGEALPGIKIGDGSAYLIDLPFVAGNVDVSDGVHINTSDYWNAQPALIARAGNIYVYSDYVVDNGDACPGIKVGDGLTYLVDLPFVVGNTEALNSHISDTSVHVTNAERSFWNDKVTCFMSAGNVETLVFTKN